MALSDKELVLGIILLFAIIGLMIIGGDLVGKAYGGYDEQSLKADIGIGQNPENVILNNDNPSSSGS